MPFRIPMTMTNKSHSNITHMIHDEDSPFSNCSSFVLYLEPIYNPLLQIYQNAITLNCKPPGPLANMVSYVHLSKLSPFQQPSPTFDLMSCAYVLLRFPVSKVGSGIGAMKSPNILMSADDIPSVFSYLQTHGYKVDTSTTTMLQDGRVLVGGVSERRFSGNRRMIAIVQYL